MSSNHNHINSPIITRDNYEEYFLLYVDEELTAEEKGAVEAFLLLHPDLQDEMDVLLSTKLTPGPIGLMDKQALFADSMKEAAVDEALLLYIDNELPASEASAVEEKLKTNPDYYQQHQLLTKTKLDATEKIIFPFKEALYRKTERRLPFYLRIAAAAVIILWAGTFDWTDTTDSSTTTTGPVASQLKLPAATKPAAPGATAPATGTATKAATAETATDNNTGTTGLAVNTTPPAPAKIKSETKTIETATIENAVTVSQPAIDVTVAQIGLSERAERPTSQQIINNAVVTSATPVRTISTEAIETASVPVDAVAAGNDHEKSGSFKGFLRKATRMIERRTGIDATNGDDELLIGAVAIKLK